MDFGVEEIGKEKESIMLLEETGMRVWSMKQLTVEVEKQNKTERKILVKD